MQEKLENPFFNLILPLNLMQNKLGILKNDGK
jgi:hypothetical protein